MKKKLLFIINVDWYFCLHWLARAKAAHQSGFDIHIATQITSKTYYTKLIDSGFSVHPISLGRKSLNPLKEWISQKNISNIIRDINPTLVHAITVKPNIYAGIICKKNKIPLIMNVTGLGMAFSSDSFRAKIAQYFIFHSYKKILDNYKNVKVIFENEDNKQLFVNNHLATIAQTIVIPGAGVDIDEYAFSAPENKGKNKTFTILFAARMLWDKGLATLIDAIEILKNDQISIRLQVAGILDTDNAHAIPLSQIEDWNTKGKIEWLGEVRSGMPDLIASADVIVLPTEYGEGVPRILIEAAAIGRPIVATNVTGCRDIVQTNGILIPPKDAKKLADALEFLYSNPQKCNEMARNGRHLVESVFAQSKVIHQMLDVYSILLDI